MSKITTLFQKKNASLVVAGEVPAIDVHFTSIVCAETQTEGKIYLRSNLRIDGLHDGDILKVDGFPGKVTVLVSKTGRVEGTIDADDVIIDGEVTGITRAQNNLYIRGTVKGEAYYGNEVDVTGKMRAHLIKFSMQVEKDITPEVEANTLQENVHVLHRGPSL